MNSEKSIDTLGRMIFWSGCVFVVRWSFIKLFVHEETDRRMRNSVVVPLLLWTSAYSRSVATRFFIINATTVLSYTPFHSVHHISVADGETSKIVGQRSECSSILVPSRLLTGIECEIFLRNTLCRFFEKRLYPQFTTFNFQDIFISHTS